MEIVKGTGKNLDTKDVNAMLEKGNGKKILPKFDETIEQDPKVYRPKDYDVGDPEARSNPLNIQGEGQTGRELKKARNSNFNISKPNNKLENWFEGQKQARNPTEYIGGEPEEEPPYDPMNDLSGDEKNLYGNVKNTQPDISETVNQKTSANKEKAENIMPHHSTKTWQDIFTDPEYEGKRGSYLLDTLGGALRAAETGNVEDTAMNRQNRVLEENYAKNIADRDTRAMNMQLEGLEAANAQQVALETNLADTMANTYIQRYKAAQDAETKKQVLEQMAADSEELFNSVFSGEDGEEKLFNLAALMGLYAGDFSLSQRLIQKYAPQLIEKFDAWLEGKGGGEEESKKKGTVTSEPIQSPAGTYIIDPQDVADNPDKYIEIPLGMGQTMLVKRWGTYVEDGKINIGVPKEEIDAIEDALMNNPNLEDEERIAIAKDWAGKGRANVTESEMKSRMSQRDENAAAQEKLEKDQQKKEEKFLTSVQDILKSNDTPQIKVKKLQALSTDGITNQVALNLYNSTMENNQKKVATSMQSAIETDGKLNNGQKAKQMRELLTNYGEYLSEGEKNAIQRKIENYDHLYEDIDPYEEQANKYIRKATTQDTDKTGSQKWWTIGKDGNGDMVFVHNNNKNALGSATYINPSTQDFTKYDGTSYLQTFIDLTEPNTLANMMSGDTLDEIQDNFKDTAEYKMMAKLLNNKSLKQAAYAKKGEKYKNEKLYLAYNTLETRFNKLLNNKLFEKE